MQIPVTCSGPSKARQTNSPHRSHDDVREATFGVVMSLTRGHTSSALPSFLILPPFSRYPLTRGQRVQPVAGTDTSGQFWTRSGPQLPAPPLELFF